MYPVKVKDVIINKRASDPGNSLRSIPELSEKDTYFLSPCPAQLKGGLGRGSQKGQLFPQVMRVLLLSFRGEMACYLR